MLLSLLVIFAVIQGDRNMEQKARLKNQLKGFTECQKEAIAEMVAGDCILAELWQEQVEECIKNDVWKPNMLLRAIAERVEELVKDVQQHV